MPKKKEIPPPTPEQASTEWIELKAATARIESRMRELRGVIEPFLEAQPEKSAELNGWKFTLVETERESFSLSKAREKLDGRVLAPYISKSSFTQIRTVWKGGEEEAA